jgi:hypothetical protein
VPRTPTGAEVNDGAAGARRAGLDDPSFPQSPVDLPLRLDDAGASPTTPQGPQQQAADIKKREKELGFGQSAMRHGSKHGEATLVGSGTFSGAAIRAAIVVVAADPRALGRPLREVWWEVYPELGPLNEAILRGEREAFFAEDLPWTSGRVRGHAADVQPFGSPAPDL